jgi:hypothetical protein
VRSKTDYGLTAYGNASKSNLAKIDIAGRSILRVILSEKSSTPAEILCAESTMEPLSTRKRWLASSTLSDYATKPTTSLQQARTALHHTTELHDSLIRNKEDDIIAYANGYRSEEYNTMACAAVIPPLNIRLASTLHGLSSIISDELQDIKQALQLVYNLQP